MIGRGGEVEVEWKSAGKGLLQCSDGVYARVDYSNAKMNTVCCGV